MTAVCTLPGEDCSDAPSTSSSRAASSWGLTSPSGQTPAQHAPEVAAVQSSTLSDSTVVKKDTELLYIQMEYCPQTLHSVLGSGTSPVFNIVHSA